MNSQNNDDSLNFSVIDRHNPPQNHADFSVQEILCETIPQQPEKHLKNQQQHQSFHDIFSKIRTFQHQNNKTTIQPNQANPSEGSVLGILKKMEQGLSFESQPYNVYEDNNSLESEALLYNKSKTQSFLKQNKQSTNKSTNKSLSKEQNIILNDYYGPLIIDFHKINDYSHYPNKKSKKMNTNSQSYFSSQQSEQSRKHIKEVKNKSRDKLETFYVRSNSKSTRNLLGVADFKKSKSKSHNSRALHPSKSHSNLKLSSQAESHPSKVFTEYYGTSITIAKSKIPEPVKGGKMPLNKLKSRQKSRSIKNKVQLLSPRGKKQVKTHLKK